MTEEEFIYKLCEKRNNEYELMSEFKNLTTKVNVKCNNCGHIFSIIPKNFLKGKTGCPVCGDGAIRTTNDLKYYIEYITNGEFELLSEYKGQEKNITIRHTPCGEIFDITAHAFISKQNCPSCYKKKLLHHTHDWYVEQINNKYNGRYILLDEFNGLQKKIRHKHICGRIVDTQPCVFLKRKYECVCCEKPNNGRLISDEEYRQRLLHEFDGEYEPVDTYINSSTRIKVKHKCGCIFDVKPHKLFLRHTLCPQCKSSKGESKIVSFLTKNNINFRYEYCFEDCKHLKCLPFDFAIFDENNNLTMLIEYDGEQHFRPVDYFGGEEAYKERVRNDKIKEDYCKDNCIRLLRIKYTEYDKLEDILSRELF